MENASKALLMAGGILIGILILALMAVLFLAGSEVFTGYEETKNSEMVQRFNSNFTKYTGKDKNGDQIKLTAHEALTIYNFANNNNINKVDVQIPNDLKTIVQMTKDISDFSGNDEKVLKKYKSTIPSDGYDTNPGYINKIIIN